MAITKRVRITATDETWETSINGEQTKEQTINYFTQDEKVIKIEELQPNDDYYIFDGYDHYHSRELFRVMGKDSDYVGDWHKSKFNAIDELKELMSKSDVILWEYSA